MHGLGTLIEKNLQNVLIFSEYLLKYQPYVTFTPPRQQIFTVSILAETLESLLANTLMFSSEKEKVTSLGNSINIVICLDDPHILLWKDLKFQGTENMGSGHIANTQNTGYETHQSASPKTLGYETQHSQKTPK